MLMQAAGVEKKKGKMRGAMNPGTETVGKVTLKHIYEIAKIKQTVSLNVFLELRGLILLQ